MPNNLKADIEVIISSALPNNPYVGTPLILPALLPVNLIERDSGVRPPRFIFRRVVDDVYTLTINGFQVIELEGRVFSTVDQPPQEWVVRYRENHDAYTIVKRLEDPEEVGWTAPTDDGNPQILVEPIGQGPFYPPQVLYKFEFPGYE